MALCAAALVVAPGLASAQDLNANRTQTLDLTVEATDVFNAAQADAREIMVSIASLISDFTVELKLFYTGTNGTSADFVTLSTTPQPAVTGIYASSASTQAITYRITAPVTAPPQTPTLGPLIDRRQIPQSRRLSFGREI